LATGLTQAAAKAGVPHQMTRMGSMMTLFFNEQPVVDWDTASRSDTALFGRYFWGLIERGVYMPCSQYEALFVSAVHSTNDIDATIAAAEKTLATL
jgi:glutamate-1-semialdehyde 2,1-aminomutase